jgi:hypothetical protein
MVVGGVGEEGRAGAATRRVLDRGAAHSDPLLDWSEPAALASAAAGDLIEERVRAVTELAARVEKQA